MSFCLDGCAPRLNVRICTQGCSIETGEEPSALLFDEIPVGVSSLAGKWWRGSTLVGIDGMTALVGHNGRYTVSGRGDVTVMTRGGRMRYHDGQQVVLPERPPPYHQ